MKPAKKTRLFQRLVSGDYTTEGRTRLVLQGAEAETNNATQAKGIRPASLDDDLVVLEFSTPTKKT